MKPRPFTLRSDSSCAIRCVINMRLSLRRSEGHGNAGLRRIYTQNYKFQASQYEKVPAICSMRPNQRSTMSRYIFAVRL